MHIAGSLASAANEAAIKAAIIEAASAASGFATIVEFYVLSIGAHPTLPLLTFA
jgi:hypothetical protein